MSAVLKDILAQVVPSLREKGYKGSGQNYRRANAEAVSVVNFQKSSGGERFYVNVGVQPLFVRAESELTPDAKKIQECECIFRRRVPPPENAAFGWPYSTDHCPVLIQHFDELYRDFVTPLMTIPGPITEARIADFSANPIHPLFGAGNARSFLHFARISLAKGNRECAAEFANAASEICPPRATSLRGQLEQILADSKTQP